MRLSLILIGIFGALIVQADPVTLTCNFDSQDGQAMRGMFQVEFDEAAQTVIVNSGPPIHASITAGIIVFEMPQSGSPRPRTAINRVSGELTVTAANGLWLFGGRCTKVDPARRAF